jgi:hypothetical protein
LAAEIKVNSISAGGENVCKEIAACATADDDDDDNAGLT